MFIAGPSYQEIYKRRKEAQNNKNSTITNLSSAPNSSKSVLLQLTKRGVPEAIHNEARRDRTLAHACPMSPLLLLGKDICQLFLFVAVLVGEMHWAHSAGAVEGSHKFLNFRLTVMIFRCYNIAIMHFRG